MTRLSNPNDSIKRIHMKPGFSPGCAGSLFCIATKSTATISEQNSHAILLVPPFAEEMNRSRRFLAILTREFAQAGANYVVLPDLFGTGDSAGEFNEATWDIWLRDICDIADTLLRQYERLSVVGVRAGCLLIDDMLQVVSRPFSNIVYIQPEHSGFDVIHRMLRVRVAAGRFAGTAAESTDELWGKFEKRENVELGGYSMGSELVERMKGKRLASNFLPQPTLGNWIEFSSDRTGHDLRHEVMATHPRTSEADSLRSKQAEVDDSAWNYQRVIARPFWQLHDHEPESDVVSKIVECVQPFS